MTKSIAKILFLLFFVPSLTIGIVSCEDDDDDDDPAPAPTATSFQATINMTELANKWTVSLRTDTIKPYTNKKGQRFNISRLRYLISDLTFHKSDGSSFTIDGYHFVDVEDPNTKTYTPATKVPNGDYSSISFTFGFDTTANTPNAYPDLNTANWNWPAMLGDGYHFMQLEGKYDSSGTEKFFATHMGTAKDMSSGTAVFEANHFVATPANSAISVNGDFSFDIQMNVEQWYEDTFEWDFNVWNAPIMPIYDAQKRLNENGHSVFTVKL
mgnify:CR=1 FL=1